MTMRSNSSPPVHSSMTMYKQFWESNTWCSRTIFGWSIACTGRIINEAASTINFIVLPNPTLSFPIAVLLWEDHRCTVGNPVEANNKCIEKCAPCPTGNKSQIRVSEKACICFVDMKSNFVRPALVPVGRCGLGRHVLKYYFTLHTPPTHG